MVRQGNLKITDTLGLNLCILGIINRMVNIFDQKDGITRQCSLIWKRRMVPHVLIIVYKCIANSQRKYISHPFYCYPFQTAWFSQHISVSFVKSKNYVYTKMHTFTNYSSMQCFRGLGLGCGHKTARMASSKTFLRPFCVRAEHSRYLTAPISFAIAKP